MTKEKKDLKKNEVADNVDNNTENKGEANASVETEQMEALKISLAEAQDKYTRLFAEFDNFKKRTAKERVELFYTANMDVMVTLIPVIDDFERAINASKTEEDIEGFRLVFNKFKSTLESKGLKTFGTEIGDDFDVDLHEAITTIPAKDEKSKGKIVDIIEKGYKLGEKVIRYTKVVIGE